MKVVGVVRDLMDRSRVQAAIGRDHDLRFVAGAQGIGSDPVDVVLVDLSRPDALAAVAAGRGLGARTIGFGPHVDDERLAEATAAGCDVVLARSQFFRRLPELLP